MGKIIIIIIVIIFCIAIFIYITQPQIIAQIQSHMQPKTQEQTESSELKPIDCSGNVVYGICKNVYGLPIDCEGNTSGFEKGTKTISYNVIPGITCPEPTIIACDLKCDIDCVGAWKNVGSCKIDRCDLSKNTIGLGKQTQEFVVSTTSKNQGKPCPGPTREVDCSLNNYIECTQCGGANGGRVPGATCDNIKTCEDLIGIGERIDKWSATSYNVLPGCITPADIKVRCSTAGEWPNCNCKYNVQDASFCNEENTVCTGTGNNASSECTVGYTLRESLKQPNNAPGICTDQLRNKYYNINLSKCICTVKRDVGNWIYTGPTCNGSTFIATSRSRPITITKTGGNKACIFSKLSNNEKIVDTVENNAKGKYVEQLNNIQLLQFTATNDLIDSTFQTVETENSISFPDNVNCKCQGEYEEWKGWTNWTDDSICPTATNYSIGDSAFNITQSRTNNRTFKISNSESLLNNYSCPEAAVAHTQLRETRNHICTRNCLGDWSGWTTCNTGCPGNAGNNRGTSTKNSSGGQATQTSTYTISKPALGTIMGTTCSDNNGATKTQPCDTPVPCTINCTGGNWETTPPCVAPACGPSSTERDQTKTSSQIRNWVNAFGPFNNGTPCPAPKTDTCSRNCQIDCQGGNWETTPPCVAPACGPSSTERDQTKTSSQIRNWVNAFGPFNNGTPCPAPKTDTCSRNCRIDCYGGNWDNTAACVAPACGPSATETDQTKTSSQIRNWVGATGPFNNGASCPTSVTDTCSRNCPIDCKGDWTGCDRVFGTDLQTYYRRKDAANGGNGNCPGHGTQQWCDGQTNNGRMFIKSDGTNMDWRNGTGNWWCLHPQEGYPANGRGLVLYQGCAVDSDKNRLRYNIASDGIIRHNYWTEYCLGNNGQSEGGYVRPTWGSGNCIKFGTGGGGIIRSKGSNYHNYCLQPITDNNSNSTSVVLKPCTMDIVF